MSSSANSQKLILLVVGLPVLLFLLGGWQAYRAFSPAGTLAEITEINEIISELETVKAEHGYTFQIELNNGQKRAVGSVIEEGKSYVSNLKTSLWIALVSTHSSWTVLGFSAMALLFGGAGVLYVRSLGKKALESRENLLEYFQSGKKMLPWILCLFSITLVFSIFAAIVFELAMFLTYGIGGRGVGKLYLAVAFGALGILYLGLKLLWNVYKSSRAALAPSEVTVMGREISKDSAPALWDFVKEVSSKTQTVMPDSIVVGLDEGFFVTEHPVHLYKSEHKPSGRVLYLPLPYMAFMTKSETATIVAHELGHFTGADTEYSLRFSPIYSAAIANLSAVHQSSDSDDAVAKWVSKPTIMLGEYFLDSFHEAVQFWSRQRELAADLVGTKAADAQTFASALLRVIALSPHVDQALGKFWNQAGEGNSDVISLVKESIANNGFDGIKNTLDSRFPHPTDSHPTVSQRLEAHNITVDDVLLQQATCVEESKLLVELGLAEGSTQECDSADTSSGTVTASMAVSSISKSLESDFAAEAASNVQELRNTLTKHAAEGTETFTVYEGTLFLKLFFYIIGIVSMLAIFGVKGDMSLKGMVFILGAIFISVGYMFGRRSKKPLATLSPEGIALGNMQAPVLWQDIADMSIVESSTNGASTYTISLILEDNANIPAFSSGRRLKYVKKENALRVSTMSLRKMKMDVFLDKLSAHWRGGCARHQLAQMDKDR